MKEQIKQEIEKTKERNEKMLKAFIPPLSEIEYNRGYIDGLRFALEQREKEDVLDKIRAEIEHFHDWAFSREEILRIIDKYKAESEESEDGKI